MSKSKNKKKSSQMVIRVEKHEKDRFQDICKDMDTSAARELRRFMRDFVAANSPAPVSGADAALPVPVEAVPVGAEPVGAEPVHAAPNAPAPNAPVPNTPAAPVAVVEAPIEAPADDAAAKTKKRAKKK